MWLPYSGVMEGREDITFWISTQFLMSFFKNYLQLSQKESRGMDQG